MNNFNNPESLQPFGELSFEDEKETLGEAWKDYFFEYAPFNYQSLQRKTYLIVGRRGCGKSSLAEHFKFQKDIHNSMAVNLEHSRDYMLQMRSIAERVPGSSDIVINSLVSLWSFIIWQIIFDKYSEYDSRIKISSLVETRNKPVTRFTAAFLQGIMQKFVVENASELIALINEEIMEADYESTKQAVLILSRSRPLIVTIDSREQYSIQDVPEMNIAAALIQCASEMNRDFSQYGIHVKVFFPDEIFPHLKEDFVLNSAKHVRNPLFLHWRPKDLVRLICWRYFKYLKKQGRISLKESEINWDNFNEVHEKLWIPYFGEKIINRRGVEEKTLPYIIRHSQLRPRQLIMICNSIAELAMEQKTFPNFTQEIIRNAVRKVELDLADELINSYSRIYKNIGDIISALSGMSMTFKGSELDKVAPRTASQWKSESYSPLRFRQILSELGVIGRVRTHRDLRTGIIEADFEFAMRDRLFINEQNTCVIHPMFYSKLNTSHEQNTVIYPFPDHPDFDILRSSN